MIKKISFYIFHKYIKRDTFFELSEFYDKTQYWPRDKMLEYQWEAFKSLLNYAYENVPYYRRLFDDIGITPLDIASREDLVKIPELSKEIVGNHFNLLKADNVDPARILKGATSGSTGTSFYFLTDKHDFVKSALQKRCYEWMGIDHLDRKMTIWGASWDVNRSKEFIKGIKAWIKSWMFLSGYNLSDSDIEKYYHKMMSFKPKLIVSYPSILFEMAGVFEKNGWFYSPKALQIGGEKLFSFQREKIERVFQAKVFDLYGARDMRLIAQECDHHQGLHIMAENVLVEVINDDGNPLQEGEGDLVITDLHNHVMPFIRYRIGDRAVITQDECTCGRGLPLLKEVLGRSFEVIQFPNGNRVGGTFWTLLLKSEPGIKSFQIVQKTETKIEIIFVADELFKEENVEKLKGKILNYSGTGLEVHFKKVNEIPVNKAGKFRFVISELKEKR
jgi:phenylacetate-CoA ligase